MIVRKVGGMPISKDAIDLTTLSKKDEATFRKIVRQQAEAGKTGPINIKDFNMTEDNIIFIDSDQQPELKQAFDEFK